MMPLRAGLLWAAVWYGTAASAQHPAPAARWPKHSITFSYGRALHAPLRTINTYGPQRGFRARGWPWMLGLEYALRLKRRLLVGATLNVSETWWRYDMVPDAPGDIGPEVRGLNSPPRIVPLPYSMIVPEITVNGGFVVLEGPRLRLGTGASLGVAWLRNRLLGFRGSHVVPQPDGSQLVVFAGGLDYGFDVYPLAGFHVQGTWQARNHNRWSLMLEGRSTLTNFYEGGYTLYGGTPTEAGGSLRGRLAYIGLRLGFGLTWGEPRQPRWVRKLQERGLPLPSP